MNWYTGTSKIALPVTDEFGIFTEYITETTRLTGSFSTPYYGEPFNEMTFERQLMSNIYINAPIKNCGSKIVIDFEYDREKISYLEDITVELQEKKSENDTTYSTDKFIILSKLKSFASIEFNLESV